jgi:DNA-binding beta-propeller fold protein YncE
MTSQFTGSLRKLSCIAIVGWLAWPAFAHAIAMFALTDVNTLVEFDTATPGAVRAMPALVGFGIGENLIGIALRPADQRLYALTRNAVNAGALYTINTSTGAATLVGVLTPAAGSTYTTLSGTRFGMKFNPFADRLRLVSDDGTNLRVVPTTAQVIADTALNPGMPHVIGVAYTNSYAGASTTTLYDIDSNADQLSNQNPPNKG